MHKALPILLFLIVGIVLAGYNLSENYGANSNEQYYDSDDILVQIEPNSTINNSDGTLSATLLIKNNGTRNVTYEGITNVELYTFNLTSYMEKGTVIEAGKQVRLGVKYKANVNLKDVMVLFNSDMGQFGKYIEDEPQTGVNIAVINVTTPKCVTVNTSFDVVVTVQNTNIMNATNITVSANELLENIKFLAGGAEDSKSFTFTAPSDPGTLYITGYAEASETELTYEDNEKTISLEVTGIDLVFPEFAAILIATGFLIAKKR